MVEDGPWKKIEKKKTERESTRKIAVVEYRFVLLPVAETIGDLGHSGWGTRFSLILIFLHLIKLFGVPVGMR